MKNTRIRRWTASPLVAVALFVLASCGAGQKGAGEDPLALIRQGRFAEARAVALQQDLADPGVQAIIAFTHVAENPGQKSAEKAVSILAKGGGDVREADAASRMLALAFELKEPAGFELSMWLAEAALGAVGLGPLALDAAPSITVQAATRELAFLVLERVGLALEMGEVAVSQSRLLVIWNSAFTLAGGSFETGDASRAWKLFTAISTMGLFANELEPAGDLSNVLLIAAVTVVESNPEIAVAARCDLASPYEDLKAAMAHNRAAIGRLEGALTSATGCTRGTYAPDSR